MGENIRNFSSRIALSSVFFLGLFGCERALAQTSSGVPILNVLVFNYSEASPALLAGAEHETSRIFGQSGIHLAWTYCRPPLASADWFSMCQGQPVPGEIRVRVLARHLTADSVFGIAMAPTFATLYCESAQRLANSQSELSVILGCLIAHEIGHVLLRHNRHTAYGIMQGRWEIHQVQLATMGLLGFTSEQAEPMQANARLRIGFWPNTVWAGEPVIIGATQQQQQFLRCVARISADDLHDTPHSNERMTIIVLEHQKFLEMRDAFHLHKTKLAFSSLEARRIYLSSRAFKHRETALRCITHELGHFATQSAYEGHAELAAEGIRWRTRQTCWAGVQ